MQRCVGTVADAVNEFGDIGIGGFDVSGLKGHHLELRFCLHFVFEGASKIEQVDRVGIADVEDALNG